MANQIELIIKIVFPLLSFIVSIIGLRTGWTYKRDKLFTSRKTISEFAYQLYKNNEDVTFKRLAEEYGIAALTKDDSLSRSQREILLNTINPVKDIDDYRKCQKLISITTHHEIFGWSKKRYKYKVYRKIIQAFTISIYFLSSLVIMLPFNYAAIASDRVLERLSHFTIWQKLGLSAYLIAVGFSICIMSLDKASKINIAERLIISNRRK